MFVLFKVDRLCSSSVVCWCRRYQDYTLEFIELSLDSNLACNALRVLIGKECGPLMGGVHIVELASHVAIMFATATSVHRMVLPHPEAIVKVLPSSISFSPFLLFISQISISFTFPHFTVINHRVYL